MPWLAVALAAGLGLSGCGEGGTEPTDTPAFRATWAGKPWEGDATAMLVSGRRAGDTLYLFGSTPANADQSISEYVRVRVVFRGTGTYSLDAGDAGVVHMLGGDVVAAEYATGETGAGRLVVREYTGAEVAGQVDFSATTTREYSPYGPAARFTGEFRAKVIRRPWVDPNGSASE
ncbi:MAG TPA: hypothetical protein VHG28_01450 [Longimicrobiaceae bacterium]|nr:hypothetical protein [Longimicrobiaceae bacterium]